MIAISKKRVELIIILLFILLLSIIWIWYGVQLKEIDHKKKDTDTGVLINQAIEADHGTAFTSPLVHVTI